MKLLPAYLWLHGVVLAAFAIMLLIFGFGIATQEPEGLPIIVMVYFFMAIVCPVLFLPLMYHKDAYLSKEEQRVKRQENPFLRDVIDPHFYYVEIRKKHVDGIYAAYSLTGDDARRLGLILANQTKYFRDREFREKHGLKQLNFDWQQTILERR